MKKIFTVSVILFFLFHLPATLFAAEKTTTTHIISPAVTYPHNPHSPYNTASATSDKNFGVTKTGLGSTPTPPDTSTPTTITDPEVMQEFPPVVNNTSSPSITINPAGAIVLGSSINDGSGALWYAGTSAAGTCNSCDAGVCDFGLGLRAYFEFKYLTADNSTDSRAIADGFTFAVMNASRNDKSMRGGAPNTTFSMGELMGYAGTGNTSPSSTEPHATNLDGLGIKPPKFAIEIDTYPNPGAMQSNGCSYNRNDTANNHVALMFWGLNPSAATMCSSSSLAGNSFPRASFDDNVHGAGDGTTSYPYNSASSGNGSGVGGYYERARNISTGYNWLEDAQSHRVRIEVVRTSSAQTYRVKAWVDCETCSGSTCTACPGSEYAYFQDVYTPYSNGAYPPKLDRIQQLSAPDNALLDQVIFGFTESTGGSLQNLQITNFAIYFPTSIVGTPSSLAFSGGGGSGTVTVMAMSGCPWSTSKSDWITITPANGTGTGSAQTVTYTISVNRGASRTGTITIAGQTFTVTQAGCTYNVGTPSDLSFERAGGNGTVNATASYGCPWTTSNNGNVWINISPSSGTGTGATQTVTYSAEANTGLARTGTMTIAGQTFTVTQAGCTYNVGTPGNLSFSSGGGTGTATVDTSYNCTWTTSNNGHAWITITPVSATGDATANYTIAANATGLARTGTMTIAGRNFTVTQAATCSLTIADNSFACKSGTGSSRVYLKVYLTDGSGNPVIDASVSYSVSGGGGSGNLTNLGRGYYGGTRTSDCGLGTGCVRTNSISGSRTVTVTATRAGCTDSPLTKTMTVP